MDKHPPSALTLKSSEAIFAVADVIATAKFYREVLGFESQWLWGDPPTFAGLCWGPVQVMLCQQPELVLKIEGHQHFFRCEDINSLYQRHTAANATIISDIENKPWGIREYTVRDINGYHLRFCGPPTYERPATASSLLPDFIRLVERMPTIEEFTLLTAAVGWSLNTDTVATALANSLYGVVAVDTRDQNSDRVVGSIRVVGDGARVFSIQDVMVIPELQNQRIGSAMMESVMHWLRTHAPQKAYVGLFTSKPAFYERYGFKSGWGMGLFL
jgi:GNAT superfamily N-acetyltransferase